MLGDAEAELQVKAFAGKPAPELDAEQWRNLPDGLKLGELQGKMVLLDVWGQWSGPCFEKVPLVEELHTTFKDRGFVLIGVHTPDRSEKLDEFLFAEKVSFPVLIDSAKTAEQYLVKTWHTYVLIDKKGHVVWIAHNPPTSERIEQLLGN